MNLGFSGTFPPYTDGDSDYNMFLLNSLSSYVKEYNITVFHNQKELALHNEQIRQIRMPFNFNKDILNEMCGIDIFHMQIGGPLVGLFSYRLLKMLYSSNEHSIISTFHPSPETIETRWKLIYGTGIHLYRSIKMKDNLKNVLYFKDTLLMQDVIKYSDKLVVTSEYQKNILSNRYRNYKSKFYDIPLGIDVNQIQSISTQNNKTYDDVKDKFNIADDSFNLLSFGALTPGKGITEVIKAIYILVNKYGYGDIKYLIVGNPYFIHYNLKLNSLIRRLNLQNNVYLIGYLPFEDVVRLMKFADIIIQPRRSKRMNEASLSLLVALCSKTPVIANGGGALNEYLIDNETGLLANYDRQDFVEKIVYLYNNQSERIRIGRNAIKWCNDNVSPKIIAKKHIEMYEMFE